MSQTTNPPAEGRPAPKPSRLESFGGHTLSHVKMAGPILIVLGIILFAIWLNNPNFLEPQQFLNFVRRSSPLIVLAIGQVFVIASGGFDLSQGSLITVTVIMSAAVSRGDEAMTPQIILMVLLVGVLVGLVNGLVTTKLKVPSIITTLAMLLMLRGGVFFWSGGAPVGSLADNFRMFGRDGIDMAVIGRLPYAVIVVILLTWLYTRLMHRSSYGHQLLAVGGGARAAGMTGVNVTRIRVTAFVISAVSAVIAGILLGGYAGVSAEVGRGMELEAISAVVLGGAAIGGGSGSVVGVAFGAFTLQALFMLLNLLGLPQPMRQSVQGLIIIGAVVYAGLRLQRGR